MIRRFPWVSMAATALAFIVHAVSPGDRLLLDPVAVKGGELWRLFTGHWVHYSALHLAVDAVLFGLSAAFVERRSRRVAWMLTIAGPPLISIAILALAPETAAYGGLSGMAATMMACCCALLWQEARSPIALIALNLFILKVILDSFGIGTATGVLPAHVQLEPVSHAAGAILGLVAWLAAFGKIGKMGPVLWTFRNPPSLRAGSSRTGLNHFARATK